MSSKGTVDWLPVYGYFLIHEERINSTPNTPNNLPNFEIFKKRLSRYLVALSSIDLEELKRAVCVLFLHDDALLISATECSRTIQFELLSSLLNHVLNSRQAAIIEGCDVMSLPLITQSTFILYIGLLIVERPFLLFSYLTKCRKCCHPIPADECLVLCSDALTVPTPHTQDGELCIVKEQDRGKKGRQERGQKEGENEGQGGEGRQVVGGQKEGQEILEEREIGGQNEGQKVVENNQNQWILLDSISVLKEMESDIMGALSSIVDYIAHASKDERKVEKWEARNTERKDGIVIITINKTDDNKNENNNVNHNIVKNDNDNNYYGNTNDTVRNEDDTGRLVHGVQCLVRLCIVGSKEGKENKDSKGNKENKENKERAVTQSNNNSNSSSSSGSGSNNSYGLWFTAMDRLLPLLGERCSVV